jgi:20S proteasome subunit beta 3
MTITVPIVVAQNDALTMNGGSVLAMAGQDCVAVAVDKRFGSGSFLVQIRHRPVLHFADSTMVAFTGLEGDVQSLRVELAAQVALKYSRGLGSGGNSAMGRSVSSTAVASLLSHVLYHRKRAPYYVEPLVIGLVPDGWLDDDVEISSGDGNITNKDDVASNDESSTGDGAAADSVAIASKCICTNTATKRRKYRPYLCSMDMIGAKSESKAFVCAGTASQSMYGTAEALWKPNLTADELIAVCGKAFLSALERDCLSGYGAILCLLTPDGIVEYDISGRSD